MANDRRTLNFVIVDDDEGALALYRQLITHAGHTVETTTLSQDAYGLICRIQPDIVLCDLMMPQADGFDLLQRIRKTKDMIQPTFIIISAKNYDVDKRHAFDLGVDGYITKPISPDHFIKNIIDIASHKMVVQFWGVRGTLPAPGKDTVRYGGNTNCVTLTIANKHFFIFDAGTGIRLLGEHLIRSGKLPIKANIFITHPHYDHINGIPFFGPMYVQGNEFTIYGANQGERTISDLIGRQMDSVYFPVTMSEFAANIEFHELKEESFSVESIPIKTIQLNHPGTCIGYRVDYQKKSMCYITDNELFLPTSSRYNNFEVGRLITFIKETDLLIIDSTYSDKEYKKKEGWGHSCVSQVVDVADRAKVKQMCLFHHDPAQTDKDIDTKLQLAQTLLKERHSKTNCVASKEGEIIEL